MKFRLPQAYFSKIMRAIVEFEMIERGDNILIGLSGGKDSLLLTYALAMMRERTKGKFSLRALTINPMFSENFDVEALSRFCASLDIPHAIEKVDIAGVIQSSPKNAPCFTCAFFRRACLGSARAFFAGTCPGSACTFFTGTCPGRTCVIFTGT